MFYRSLLTGACLSCALFSGGTAFADDFWITNNDPEVAPGSFSLIDSLGSPLSGGTAVLGAFNNNTWSYNGGNWYFESTPYNPDQFTYSDLVSMRDNFTSTLSGIDPDQNGSVSDGRFNLSGQFQQNYPNLALGDNAVTLMVNGSSGELAVFVFKSVENDALLTYNQVDYTTTNPIDLALFDKNAAQANEYGYYIDCILGTFDPAAGAFQLVPEPATATLSLLGLAALMVRRRRH